MMNATEMIALVVYMYGLIDKTINIGIQAELINVLVDRTFKFYACNQNSTTRVVLDFSSLIGLQPTWFDAIQCRWVLLKNG